MSDTLTVTVEGVGECTLHGTGPWKVRPNTTSSHEIVDSTGRVTNPTVMQKFSTTGMKPNVNVSFARRSQAQAVVEAANAALGETAPTETPVEEPIVEETPVETPTEETPVEAETDAETNSESTEA